MGASGSRQRDVRLIVGAVGVSALGDFLLWIPLTLYLQETTDSGLAVAALVGLALYRRPSGPVSPVDAEPAFAGGDPPPTS